MNYFAYGSNMDPNQMHKRCPEAKAIARGRLTGWRFFINERGVASIERMRHSTVLGIVYKVSSNCVRSLDRHEGVYLGRYGKFFLDVETLETRNLRRCLVYIDPSIHEGFPRQGYMNRILYGATHHNLPRSYVGELLNWKE